MVDHVLTVDADGHVLEPRDTWIDYIEPAYRDRAIRIAEDEQGLEVLLIDGKPLKSVRGSLAALGGIELDPADGAQPRAAGSATRTAARPVATTRRRASRSWTTSRSTSRCSIPPSASAGRGMVTDPALATAYTRAYNRYIVDFCSHDPARLVPVAHISLIDPRLGAVAEVDPGPRCGLPGRVPVARHARPAAAASSMDPAFDPFWAAAADLDMPVGFHVVVRDQPVLPVAGCPSGAPAASCSSSPSWPST